MAPKPSDKRLKTLFNLFNSLYWDGSLPSHTIVRYGEYWEMTEKKPRKKRSHWWGHFTRDRGGNPSIVISGDYRKEDRMIERGEILPSLPHLLLHEMAHLETRDLEKPDHGPKFKAEVRRLKELGAFRLKMG